MSVNQPGKVYLVGAGIGGQEFLTIRGQQLLAQAEILIYDALAHSSLLELVPLSCHQIYVGKRGGKPSISQGEINQLLVNYCQEGQQVVRLKSGDPFIFGRANEEIKALTKAQCNFELIPGISSALAAPLLAGISLTDKMLSRCFAVLSGHQPDLLDWSALAGIDTLVMLMAGRTLASIVQNLMNHGRSTKEPIAIIRQAGRAEQEIIWGTLADIVETTAQMSLSPAVIVIGQVVTQSKSFSTNLPLANKTILVTRSAEQSPKFTNLLQRQGATVLEMPALVITPPSSWQALDQAISNLHQFQWLILTSANGVNYFFERLKTLGYDARALGGIKIAVVGRKTATVLKEQHLNSDFIPPNYVADSLIAHFPESLTGQTILFPRVETGGRTVLVQELSQQGAEVVEVAAYQSQCPLEIAPAALEALQGKQVNCLTFASSKTVRNFYQLLLQKLQSPSEVQNLLASLTIASIGPQTSLTCQELLGRVDLEAKEYTLEGLTNAIANYKFA